MSAIPNPASTTAAFVDDPRWGVVERLIASPGFAKSGRLTQFLVFVCSSALSGHSAEINESQVGIHVFGRPSGYNPTDDSIVRSHARLLRKRLDEYFDGEGRGEPYRIRIPKGGYVPCFEEQAPAAGVMETPIYEGSVPKMALVPARIFRRRWVVATAIAAIGFGIYGWQRKSQTPEAAAARFWVSMCNQARPTLIVPSDTSLVNFKVMTGREVGLNEYIARNFRSGSTVHATNPSDLEVKLASRPFTGVVDMQFCWRLAQSSLADVRRTTIRWAGDLRTQDLMGSNVLLIGARRANPWVELFDHGNNFQGLFESVRGDYVLNRAPKRGEHTYYTESSGAIPGESWAVVSYVPGLTADDRAMIISGTTTAGTEAALDFVLNPAAFGRALNQIAGVGNAAPWFEILLRTGSVNLRAPGRAEVITWRNRAR